MINHLIPFVNSANEVLSMYSLRQRVAEKKINHHSMAEIEWCCHQLYSLSGAAAYAGHEKEAEAIKSAADYWKQTGIKPDSILQ